MVSGPPAAVGGSLRAALTDAFGAGRGAAVKAKAEQAARRSWPPHHFTVILIAQGAPGGIGSTSLVPGAAAMIVCASPAQW